MKTMNGTVHISATETISRENAGFGSAAWRYCNIIKALILHDIKNRFFGSGLGQIVMVLWPFAHIILLIVIYTVTNRPHPYGDSLLQYTGISVFPFIILSYVGRWIVFSAVTNRSFLQYPIIRPIDILVARAILETISISIVAVLLLILLYISGAEVMPADLLDAAGALLGTLCLAYGLGFINAPFAFIIPLWQVVVSILIICSWAASGVLFVVSELPEAARNALSYNPLLHCTEWFRVAFYSDYPSDVLDRAYVIECGVTMLTLGLILNLAMRRLY